MVSFYLILDSNEQTQEKFILIKQCQSQILINQKTK